MGLALNIVLFFLVLSLVFQTLGSSLGLENTCAITSTIFHADGSINWDVTPTLSIPTQLTVLIGLLAAAGLASLVIGSFTFPNPFTLFAGVTSVMLVNFVKMPLDCLGGLGMPSFLTTFLIAIFSVLLFMKILDWYKAGSEL